MVDENQRPDHHRVKLDAARELLLATKRDLQLVDEQLAILNDGRIPVMPADDVSTEHRAYFLSAVDDRDQQNGILLGAQNDPNTFGFSNAKIGYLRNQEDAAFVVTGIFGAIQIVRSSPNPPFFIEDYADDGSFGADDSTIDPLLRITDVATGRNLVAGMSTGPFSLDRGVVPLSYISSIRPGLGSNMKNALFSEFTVPRSGDVRVEVFNMGVCSLSGEDSISSRVFLSLVGYKVYGA